jgi:putative transcriptional regulator
MLFCAVNQYIIGATFYRERSIFLHQMAKLQLNRIKAVLAETNKTSKDLAAHLDKTESTVSRWCTNEVQPSIETLYEISKFLKVDIRMLLTSTEK